MKKNTSIRIDSELIKKIATLADKEDRSSNYYYEKFITAGFKKEMSIKNGK